jgi:hypothetical protein
LESRTGRQAEAAAVEHEERHHRQPPGFRFLSVMLGGRCASGARGGLSFDGFALTLSALVAAC